MGTLLATWAGIWTARRGAKFPRLNPWETAPGHIATAVGGMCLTACGLYVTWRAPSPEPGIAWVTIVVTASIAGVILTFSGSSRERVSANSIAVLGAVALTAAALLVRANAVQVL